MKKKKTSSQGFLLKPSVKLTPGRIVSPDHLAAQYGIDKSTWEMRRPRVKTTKVACNGTVEKFHSVKAQFVRIDASAADKRLLEIFSSEIGSVAPRGFRSAQGVRGGQLVEVSIPDYIGMEVLAGGKNIDASIERGVAKYVKARNELLSHLGAVRIARIVMPVTDEFCDLVLSKAQSAQWSKIFLAGVKVFTETVEAFARLAPVDIMVVGDRSRSNAPGGRSKIAQSKPYLGIYLTKWFSHHKGIAVDNKIEPRKYYPYRKTLLTFVNDRTLKGAALASIVSTERPVIWGKVNHTEVHFGEVSVKEDCREYNGVAVRKVDSLCPARLLVPHKSQVVVVNAAEAHVYDTDGYLETTYFGS